MVISSDFSNAEAPLLYACIYRDILLDSSWLTIHLSYVFDGSVHIIVLLRHRVSALWRIGFASATLVWFVLDCHLLVTLIGL